MPDLFAPLRDAETVPSLPPEAVRRRGDRLRRRRAGLQLAAAACAVAVVVGGGALIGGPDSGSSSGPADPGAPIPAELDLADGLPRQPVSSEVPKLVVCGERTRIEDLAIADEKVSMGDRGDINARGLTVYPDTATAQSVAGALAAQFRGCPRYTDRRGRRIVTSIAPTDYGDQSWVVKRQWTAPGPDVDFPEVIEVVRQDASLLVVTQREVHGIRIEDLRIGTSRQVEWLLDHQLCLLTDDGCPWRSDPDVLRPDGWGPLRLGMSRAEVAATDGTGDFSDAADCTTVEVGGGRGMLSEDRLVSIQVPIGVTTPDGIGLGSTSDDVFDV